MRSFRQGNLDRFCSVYSVLNSMQLLGVHLPHNKAQAMYDYIIDQLNFYNSFFDTAENGADYKRLEQIMSFAKEYVKTVFKAEITYHRPFYNTTLSFEALLDYMKRQQSEGKSVIVRIRSNEFDHYSVFYGVSNERMRLFDSDGLPSIKLNQISHIKNVAKHQLLVRQMYVLELCK